jgi:ABC-2 type transport system ATP-binding protein
MHQGSLLIEDSLAGLRRRLGPGRRLIVELDHVDAPLTERLGQEPYVLDLQVANSGRQLELLLEDGQDVRPRLSQLITESGGVILRMESEEMSLEDAFVTLTDQNVSRLAGAS